MIIIIRVDCPVDDPQGMKELIAMRLEDLGREVRVVEVREEPAKQETLWR